MMMVFFFIVMFIGSLQPMMMVSVLVFVTLAYSVVVYEVMGSFWFSYALMMVMLSGVLVVFTYVVSMTPNEMFEVYSPVVLLIFGGVVLSGIYKMHGEDGGVFSLKLWSSFLGGFSLFLVGFLLGVMIMVVWLCSMSEGAVRVS